MRYNRSMKVKLGQIGDVSSGYSFRQGLASFPDGDKKLIRPSDLDDLDLSRISAYEIDAPTHSFHGGEILISNKGKFRAAFIYRPGDYVIPSSIFTIRITGSSVAPEFVAFYLNSRSGRAAVSSIARGSNIQALTKQALEELEIPMPSLERQKAVIAAVHAATNYVALARKKAELAEYCAEDTIDKFFKEEK